MVDFEILNEISIKTSSKIVLLVFDGLGGLPHPETGKTELETARKPNLDRLAAQGVCGLHDPVGPGITPGSGPGHLSLFGYDPVRSLVGRGVLEALGVDFNLKDGDVAARCNYCTVDDKGVITDRRAGRIPTEKNAELCQRLREIKIGGIDIFILPGKEHRFAVVFRGNGLGGDVSDTDPQKVGLMPKESVAYTPGSERTALVVNEFVVKARTLLADSHPANMILFRGIAQRPKLPSMGDIFKLDPAAIATYPMYRGLARLVGMTILNTGSTFNDELDTLAANWDKHDFFFVHIKQTDSAGEDGDFDRKVRVIAETDVLIPKLMQLKPDVLVVTGDHSTPALLKGHSWHPVPVFLYSRYCRTDEVREFSEKACARGGMGRIRGSDIMLMAMANALKLDKFGA
ncbi:MAG: 2,3-bisphosphoglycerate-independent phosphoglycerate mutase [Dehalococcoidia bacterium]|nr:2,3-bisphosphoglycerate-independent phosphoglycerate mutase [Dehalococcoidia bacterium]